MGRKKQIISDSTWYVPDIEDNRMDQDPFRVLIQPMTGREADEADRALGQFTKGAKFNSVDRAVKHRDSVVSSRVLEVYGYEAPDGHSPKDGGELCVDVRKSDGNEPDLVLDEIYQAIRDHSKLRDGLWDPSKSPSGST